MLGALQDDQDPLAPLSKRYQLTEEEAKAIPKKHQEFLGRDRNKKFHHAKILKK